MRGLFGGLIPFALLVVPGFLLIGLEPDLGTAVVFVLASVSIFFMAGAVQWGVVVAQATRPSWRSRRVA